MTRTQAPKFITTSESSYNSRAKAKQTPVALIIQELPAFLFSASVHDAFRSFLLMLLDYQVSASGRVEASDVLLGSKRKR